MKRIALLCMGTVAALTLPAGAESSRQLDAHEHGAGTLAIAVEQGRIAMELEAPGADIVGFEYEAKTDTDKQALDTAIADLARPFDLFVFPSNAGCTVTQANVALVGEEDHDHGDGEEHAGADTHAHDDEEKHEHAEAHEHEHEEKHAEAGEHEHEHDEKHAEADEHAHEEKHAEHHDEEEAERHTEFHAEYLFDCSDTSAIDMIAFPYFERFKNALELDVSIVTDKGAKSFEVERAAPELDLRDMI